MTGVFAGKTNLHRAAMREAESVRCDWIQGKRQLLEGINRMAIVAGTEVVIDPSRSGIDVSRAAVAGICQGASRRRWIERDVVVYEPHGSVGHRKIGPAGMRARDTKAI